MSTDGTKPPTIAPKNRPETSGFRAGESGPRPVSSPRTGSTPTQSAPAATASTATATETASTAAPPDASGPASLPVTDRPLQPRQMPGGTAERKGAGARGSGEDERAGAKAGAAASAGVPRRVRLAVSKIDPWSVMKLSFLLSVAAGIMIVVAAAVVWQALDNLTVFTSINSIMTTLSGDATFFDITEYASYDRWISLATMIGIVDIVLLTALSTIGAFLYNIVAALVGGIHLTLTDD